MDMFFAKFGSHRICFRVVGQGPAIVLLHASPSSSRMMIPLANVLKEHYTVIAPDTPGYGASSDLDVPPKDISTYTTILHDFVEHLGLQSFALYGTATGAQLAIRYALDHPENVSHLFLDNAAHFSDELRQEILKSYFPDLTPQYDGSHLPKLWTMVRDLFVFFPWCFRKPNYRLASPVPPPTILHAVATDFMVAGPNYHWAYRAAFNHERAEYVQQVTVPCTIFHWQGSIIEPHIRALLRHPMPANVATLAIPAPASERMLMMGSHIKQKASGLAFQGTNTWLDNTEENDIKPALTGTLSPMEPDMDGTYLLKAWNYLRDRELFTDPAKKMGGKNGYESALNPKGLQAQLTAWMQIR